MSYNRFIHEYHTESWLGIDELKVLSDWVDYQFSIDAQPFTSTNFQGFNLEINVFRCYLFGESFKDIGTDLLPKEITDYRVVFWFDN